MTSADLIAARTALGMSQKQLAEALGLTDRQIGNLERGRSPIMRQTELAVKYLLEQNANVQTVSIDTHPDVQTVSIDTRPDVQTG